ncbi:MULTISPECIES: sorbosone dehydrogenase family protein [Pseudomonas]|uniref:PQQ-dependent sugar dehydrogenase n=1 Tax=Pseudomonas TaxID=286 RepID=UPI001CFB5868|nr:MULTISPECIES: sorbosone dehydrogenase family protein [Pseudomonas]
MKHSSALTALSIALLLSGCNGAGDATETHGADPKLPTQERGLLPTMKIAEPTAWGDQKPRVPEGYSITAIANDLKIPRQTLVLPNGDILVSEGKGGTEAQLKPKDVIAALVKARGTTPVKGGNRLTLLRDADGDGVYELKTVFAENLNAPYGLAFANGKIYVANQDALVSFDYTDGQTKASGAPTTITDLPARINHHWTKSLAASPDGKWLYVGIGSNSNITERGMEVEQNRARVWQIDATTGAHRPYATGIRNPTSLTIQPGTGQLWAVANERDELGPDLVPDYLTSVRDGAFYGWPYSYWGQNVDTRAQPQNPERVAAAIKPDYALGSHVAALGVTFSIAALGDKFADGAFVGEHGSWNRENPVGYKVVFVPFSNGKPSGEPIDFATGFRGEDGKTRGRPVGVTVDPKGALIIADDLSNTVWRVTRNR